jgi:Protein of unknown function (DUF1566)
MIRTLSVIFLLVMGLFADAQVAIKSMQFLPGTGQTQKFTTTYGEDADHTMYAPFYVDSGNGTITDTVTGLMWQKTDGGEMTIDSAVRYCNTLTLAGYNDWHLPRPYELFSLNDLQNVNPALNSVFTVTSAQYWWSDTRQVNDSVNVWCTNAGGGIGNKPDTETVSAGGTKSYHVRAVRYPIAPDTIAEHFTDNSDGTITDNVTNLIWQKSPYTDSLTWEDALIYADSLTLLGDTDWRLPNIKELESLNDETLTSPSLNRNVFNITGTSQYWSSTSLPNFPTKAWYLDTRFGITTYNPKTSRLKVLCVRGNQVKNPVTTGVNVINAHATDMVVFPNPFNATIRLQSATGHEFYELTNSLGQLIYAGTQIEQQNLGNIADGFYLLKVTGNTTAVFKLIKQ